MRGSSGAGLGMVFRRAASGITNHVICGGQSNGVGFGQAPSVSTSQPFNNLMVHDSSGTYDVTQPNAGTLSTVALVSPPRAGVNAGIYPTNINNSENPDVAFSNQLTALFRSWHYDDFIVASTNHAQGGAPLSAIAKGTQSYNAAVYEGKVVKRLAAKSAPSAALWWHGEADATAFNVVYGSGLETYRQNVMGDWATANWGVAQVPFIMAQQNSSPVNLTGPNLTASAMLALAQANPGTYLLTGPGYIYPTPGDALHYGEVRPLAEKMAEALFRWLMFGRLITVWPVGAASRSGNVVTLTFSNPNPPLVFDPTIAEPHGVSTRWSMWAGAHGFEAWDNPLTLSSVTGSGVLIGLTFTGPHNYGANGTQVVIAVQGGLGNTAANGVFTATVTSPTAVTLNGTTGNGAFTGFNFTGPHVFTPIGITGVAIVNPASASPQVQITLSRPPTTGGSIAYAEQSDCPYGQNTLSVGQGRWGTLRDSDPFRGRSYNGLSIPATYYFNWCVEFTLGMP
jgi:Carbohydrate esterase, sialic acid-specific acetylesterase